MEQAVLVSTVFFIGISVAVWFKVLVFLMGAQWHLASNAA
jgi:hypothetical protein